MSGLQVLVLLLSQHFLPRSFFDSSLSVWIIRHFSALRFSPSGPVRVQRCSSNQDQLRRTLPVHIGERPPDVQQLKQRQEQKASGSFQPWPGRGRSQAQGGGGALLQRERVWTRAASTAAAQRSSGGSQSQHGVVGRVGTQVLPAHRGHPLLLHRTGVQPGGHLRCH